MTDLERTFIDMILQNLARAQATLIECLVKNKAPDLSALCQISSSEGILQAIRNNMRG